MARTKCFNCKKTIKKGDKVIKYNLGNPKLTNPLVHEDCKNPTGNNLKKMKLEEKKAEELFQRITRYGLKDLSLERLMQIENILNHEGVTN